MTTENKQFYDFTKEDFIQKGTNVFANDKRFDTFVEKYRKFNGKTINFADLKQVDQQMLLTVLEVITTINIYAPNYLERLFSDYAYFEGKAKEIRLKSDNEWHESVGAGKASAHFKRYSSVESKVYLSEKYEQLAEKVYKNDISAIVKLCKVLSDFGKCFDSKTASKRGKHDKCTKIWGKHYRLIWALIFNCSLSFETVMGIYTDFLDADNLDHYIFCGNKEAIEEARERDSDWYDEDEDESDVDYTSVRDLKYKMMYFLKYAGKSITFPYLSDEELDSLSNIFDYARVTKSTLNEDGRRYYRAVNRCRTADERLARAINDRFATGRLPIEWCGYKSKETVDEEIFDKDASDAVRFIVRAGESWLANSYKMNFLAHWCPDADKAEGLIERYFAEREESFSEEKRQLSKNFETEWKCIPYKKKEHIHESLMDRESEEHHSNCVRMHAKPSNSELHELEEKAEAQAYRPVFFDRKERKWVDLNEFLSEQADVHFRAWVAEWKDHKWIITWKEIVKD